MNDMEEDIRRAAQKTDAVFKTVIRKKEDLSNEKMVLDGEAYRIFVLYEITREIISSLNEKDAFKIFTNKLKENVAFDECLFIDAGDERIKVLQKDEKAFVCPLQGKERIMGYVIIYGLDQSGREIAGILANQYALGLRRVRLYEEIERIAITDGLTTLHTRRHMMDRLAEEINRSRSRKISMSLLMVDVDHFKAINDSYGHLTGDKVLREVAQVILESIREIDIAGRFGGEEFMVVLPETDPGGARYVAERIREAAEKAVIRAYDNQVKLTLSVGIATYPADARSRDELIDKADWALYRAKKTGRNRIVSFGVYK